MSKSYRIDDVFSPSAPIQSNDLFFGRLAQLDLVCDAINERGQHFVVYGERGVGKTSLANILSSHILNVVVTKVTCNRHEDFKQIWKKALSKVRFQHTSQGTGYIPEKNITETQLDLFLPDGDTIDALDLQSVLEQVQRPLLFVFDEFDSVTSAEFQAAFADTIKTLSDNAPHVSIGIVGIADSVDGLIGSHPSIERCLRQIKMPRMSKAELHQIVDRD